MARARAVNKAGRAPLCPTEEAWYVEPMRLLTLVNHRAGLKPDQSTTALLTRAVERYGQAWVAGVNDVSLRPDGDVEFSALAMHEIESRSRVPRKNAAVHAIAASSLDAVLIRTNPGRDQRRAAEHEATLNLCRLVKSRGTLVLNDPDHLPKASDKLYLAYLPEEVRPKMLVTREAERLRRFVEDNDGRSVLKPLFGTQGRGVFRVTSSGPNLSALIEVLTGDGYVIAQEYLRRAPEGDTRVVIVDGAPLTVDGKVCAVRRVPKAKEFRSNVHLGGHAQPGEPSAAMIRAAARIGAVLAEHGIWMAGVDMIGTRAVEVNVRSPGGLVDACEFEGVDFIGAVLDSVVARLGGSGRADPG